MASSNYRYPGLRSNTNPQRIYTPWFNDPQFADLSIIADFPNNRYAITTVTQANIATATAAQLKVKREATFSEIFAFTCSSSTERTYRDSGGVLRTNLAINAPRFDWSNGRRQLAINAAATNLLLNSATLVTQSVTVTATTYTLSFEGTGSVVRSGVASGTLNGTGASTRVNASFATTAGSLTLTVTGDVRNAQLEANTIASAYIPTTSAAVTRADENARFTPLVEALVQRAALTGVVRGQNNARNGGRIIGLNGTGLLMRTDSQRNSMIMEGNTQLITGDGTDMRSSIWAGAFTFGPAGRALVRDGVPLLSDTNTPIATRTIVHLGRDGTGSQGNWGDGWYDFVAFGPDKADDALLTAYAITYDQSLVTYQNNLIMHNGQYVYIG